MMSERLRHVSTMSSREFLNNELPRKKARHDRCSDWDIWHDRSGKYPLNLII